MSRDWARADAKPVARASPSTSASPGRAPGPYRALYTRTVEAYRLKGASYVLVSRHAAGDTFSAEPFADLTLTPEMLGA